MFYIQKDEIRLMPAGYDGKTELYKYDDICYLGEARLWGNLAENMLSFKIEWKGAQAGEISLHNMKWFNRKGMLTIFIYPEFQGKGIGLASMRMLIDFSFRVMNLYRLEAEIVEGNEASLRLIEKLGFTREGTLRQAKYLNGRFFDIYVYGLVRPEWENFNIY